MEWEVNIRNQCNTSNINKHETINFNTDVADGINIDSICPSFEGYPVYKGKDNTHFAYWDEVENEDYINFTKPKNFIIYLNDSIIRVDHRSMEGLFSNDFDKFYHDQPIGQMRQKALF